MHGAELVFWCAVLLLAYTYAGYPAILRLRAMFAQREVRRAPATPAVGVLIAAHNEAETIGDRIRNLLAQDYPAHRLEIVVASDGSTDATVELARRCGGGCVRVVPFRTRRGKSSILNDLVPAFRAPIVVLADARQRFAPDAIRMLAARFGDPAVGAVSGELVLDDPGRSSLTGRGVGAYWKYEKFLRRNESRVDSTVGVTGAIYAIRRELFQPIAPDTLLDDVLIPMNVVRRGRRVVFEPAAVAFDRPAPAQAEFARKVRTLAGNFQLFWRAPWLLSPVANRIWFQTFSHKFCRLLGPPCLAAAFAANLLLLEQPLYRMTLAAQLAFYLAAALGRAVRDRAGASSLLGVPYTFCLLNWAVVVGFLRFAGGRQRVTWERATGT